MSIHVLDQDTINKIAAGEVIERPMAVVKELIENAIDAGANSITVEIKDGGKSLIRITDNGSGIEEEDIELAFTPHATSKIHQVQDLLSVSTLGFRGEALASIASVSQLEMLTKTRSAFNGYRYVIDGGSEKKPESIGCPDGTTFLVRNLFYNTPARLKFLKTSQTEAGYISGVIERMALSHPEISFRFINQNQLKLHTSGNGNLKDVIYNIYGRDIASNLLSIDVEKDNCHAAGFIGKPVISRGNRSYINYFINGRYIKSNIVHRAIEEAYSSFMMQHKYPFTVIHFTIDPSLIDVNVHPQKMEIRFTNEKELYKDIHDAVSETLRHREFIPEVTFGKEEKKVFKSSAVSSLKNSTENVPPKDTQAENTQAGNTRTENTQAENSQIENAQLNNTQLNNIQLKSTQLENTLSENTQPESTLAENTHSEKILNNYQKDYSKYNKNEAADNAVKTGNNITTEAAKPESNTNPESSKIGRVSLRIPTEEERNRLFGRTANNNISAENTKDAGTINGADGFHENAAYNTKQEPLNVHNVKQESLFETNIMSPQAAKDIKIIGQVFSTYWILQYDDSMFMIDQHAAHEKVLYERFMKQIQKNEPLVQMINPPVVLSLSMIEQQVLEDNIEIFEQLGYCIENFGGREYMVNGVPAQLPDVATQELLIEIIDNLVEDKTHRTPETLLDRIATMSCKAAVKGGSDLPIEQAHELLKELMSLENPYNCPHGRPTMIRMTKRELEKKFKRIL